MLSTWLLLMASSAQSIWGQEQVKIARSIATLWLYFPCPWNSRGLGQGVRVDVDNCVGTEEALIGLHISNLESWPTCPEIHVMGGWQRDSIWLLASLLKSAVIWQPHAILTDSKPTIVWRLSMFLLLHPHTCSLQPTFWGLATTALPLIAERDSLLILIQRFSLTVRAPSSFNNRTRWYTYDSGS